MSDQFGLLYAAPTFLEGIARSIDIGDTLTEYNDSESAEEADTRALRSDWNAVGKDLWQSMVQFQKDYAQKLTHG